MGNRVCKAITVMLSGIIVNENFLPIELGRLDLILGMEWLCTMGFVGVHWPLLTMTFDTKNGQVIPKGDPSLTKAELSLKAMTSN